MKSYLINEQFQFLGCHESYIVERFSGSSETHNGRADDTSRQGRGRFEGILDENLESGWITFGIYFVRRSLVFYVWS